MLSEGRFPLARAAVPQAWRGLRVPALSLLSLPGDGVPGAVPSGEGCVRLVLRACPSTRPERVGGHSRHRASKIVFPAGIRMPGPNGLPRRAEIAKSLSCDPAARPVVARKLLPAGSESSFGNQYFPFHSVRIRSAICRSLGLSSGV